MTAPIEVPDSTYYTYDKRYTSSIQITPTSDFVSWDDYFDNSDPDNCGITSCALYESDCVTLMTSSEHVTMEVSTPWAITMDRSIVTGYSLEVCIICDNTAVQV
jgi:hypothetical protein